MGAVQEEKIGSQGPKNLTPTIPTVKENNQVYYCFCLIKLDFLVLFVPLMSMFEVFDMTQFTTDGNITLTFTITVEGTTTDAKFYVDNIIIIGDSIK